MTMAAEIKNRMGPPQTTADRSEKVPLTKGSPVKPSGGGCC